MRRALNAIAVLACAWASQPAAALAQAPQDERGRFEIAAGPVWTGRASFGSQAATETTVAGGRFDLFSTTTEFAATAGVDGELAVRLTRSLDVVGSVSYSRPELRTSISGDAEGASPTTASESIQRLTVEGGVRWHFPRWAVGNHVPFVSAGAGYLRDVHEGSTLVAPGQTLSAGGGMRFRLTSGEGTLKAAGLRAEARVVVRRKGAGPERLQPSPALAASVFFRF